jgi:hypothetical protein
MVLQVADLRNQPGFGIFPKTWSLAICPEITNHNTGDGAVSEFAVSQAPHDLNELGIFLVVLTEMKLGGWRNVLELLKTHNVPGKNGGTFNLSGRDKLSHSRQDNILSIFFAGFSQPTIRFDVDTVWDFVSIAKAQVLFDIQIVHLFEKLIVLGHGLQLPA